MEEETDRNKVENLQEEERYSLLVRSAFGDSIWWGVPELQIQQPSACWEPYSPQKLGMIDPSTYVNP